MFGLAQDAVADIRRPARRGPDTARNRVDPRPIPVGYREFPITMLPARDGEPRGNVRRSCKRPELLVLRQLDVESRQYGVEA